MGYCYRPCLSPCPGCKTEENDMIVGISSSADRRLMNQTDHVEKLERANVGTIFIMMYLVLLGRQINWF